MIKTKFSRGKVWKKGMAWFLILTLLMGTMSGFAVSVPVQAEVAESVSSDKKTITGLGVTGIADPVRPESGDAAWQGSYVYYGRYRTQEDFLKRPVRYRVLDAETEKFGGTTLFLDCDLVMMPEMFDGSANDWSASSLKAYLNGASFLNNTDLFTKAERNAIAAATVEGHELNADTQTGVGVPDKIKDVYGEYVPLTGEKIFVLDAEDVVNEAYGYSQDISGKGTNREKKGIYASDWWLRSADRSDSYAKYAGYVGDDGSLYSGSVTGSMGVSPAFHVDYSSILFTSVVSKTAGEAGAEYKLTILDKDMNLRLTKGVTKTGDTVYIPFALSGANFKKATQISVLILDKEYKAGNTNGASVLLYEKLTDLTGTEQTGSASFTLPSSLLEKKEGEDYHVYVVAEAVSTDDASTAGVDESLCTDYASAPVEVHLWEAPTAREISFGTEGIIDPAVPNTLSDNWKGCYVYYGACDTDYDGVTEPVRYRVLDASTTQFGKEETMFLDCDTVLGSERFDKNRSSNKKANDWSVSDLKNGLNGDVFLNKEGRFTAAEKDAIAESTVAGYELCTDDESDDGVPEDLKRYFKNYVPLTGEKIFLLDAGDVVNEKYGYSHDSDNAVNREKRGAGYSVWWIRSALYEESDKDPYAGRVGRDGCVVYNKVDDYVGFSPAFNLKRSCVLFSSTVAKPSTLTDTSKAIGTTGETAWKLTLKDEGKAVSVTDGKTAVKKSDGTVTVPYTYTDVSAGSGTMSVNRISVMITDKSYAEGNANKARILYYGALGDIKNTQEETSSVEEAPEGVGSFTLPADLQEKSPGTDYHVYLVAEHVNEDDPSTTKADESLYTDYASLPAEVPIKTMPESVRLIIPEISAPQAGRENVVYRPV